MSLLFYPQKSYRHPALRDQASACVVHDDLTILGAKVQKSYGIKHYGAKKLQKNFSFGLKSGIAEQQS